MKSQNQTKSHRNHRIVYMAFNVFKCIVNGGMAWHGIFSKDQICIYKKKIVHRRIGIDIDIVISNRLHNMYILCHIKFIMMMKKIIMYQIKSSEICTWVNTFPIDICILGFCVVAVQNYVFFFLSFLFYFCFSIILKPFMICIKGK